MNQLTSLRFKNELQIPHIPNPFFTKDGTRFIPYLQFLNGKAPDKKYYQNEVVYDQMKSNQVVFTITRDQFTEQGLTDGQEGHIELWATVKSPGIWKIAKDEKLSEELLKVQMDSSFVNDPWTHGVGNERPEIEIKEIVKTSSGTTLKLGKK